MTRRVRFRAAAERDLLRLDKFLADLDQRAADRRMEWLQGELGKLAEHPFRGRPAGGANLREATLRFGKTSYLIRYQVTDDAIRITRIWHGREDRRR
jgi:plasmid stabilization system protein ParE